MPFDKQPTLKGTLLELRPLRRDDWEGLFAVASDPLIWEQHPQRLRYTEPVFRVYFNEAIESGGAVVAIDRNTKKIIGASRFHGYNEAESEIEIGWTFLARAYWGGRYNAEMKRLMLDHSFQFVASVVLLIGKENWRSQRAAEKIGAVRDGTRMQMSQDGVEREVLVFRLKRESA